MMASCIVASYKEAFLRLFYPAYCGICNTFLSLEEAIVCRHCYDKLRALRFAPEEAVLDQRFTSLDEGWALYPYQSPIREVLVGIKFSKSRQMIGLFKEELRVLADTITSEIHYDGLVPIPMDRQKLIEREFNQANLIADLISSHTQIPVKNRMLRKKYNTPAQSQLNREERKVNLFGAFEVPKTKHVTGKSFLLVDDIFTTGATAEEVARSLKSHGAKRVDLLTLARTIAPS